MELTIITSAIVFGFVTGFHCLGMCGPIAVALPLKQENRIAKFFSAVLYNIGRAVTYAIIGAIFGFFGQSFAMAGLLSNTSNAANSSLPGLGELPVLGPLFRSVEYQQKETELVILVTANLVEPLNIDPSSAPLPGFLIEAPNDWKLYIDGDIEKQDLAKIDEIDAQWLKHLGLDGLSGPGAWDEYDQAAPVSQADIAPENPDAI